MAKKYITRTISTATATVFVVNPLEMDKGVETEKVSIENPPTDKTVLLKAIKSEIESTGKVFIAWDGTPMYTEKVYGVTLEDFMKMAIEIERPESQKKKA